MKVFDNLRNEIINFYDFDENEQKAILRKVINLLNSTDQNTLIREIREDFLQEPQSGIGVIYEAITHHPDKWSDFIVEEVERAFEAAKVSDHPGDILESLVELSFVKNKKAAFVSRIIRIAENNLSADHPMIRREAISRIGDWLDDSNKHAYPAVIAKIQERLQDKNWKVRYLAELELTDLGALPPGFSRSLMDKIKIYFGNPFK